MFTTGDVMKARSYSYRSVYNEFQVMDCFRIICDRSILLAGKKNYVQKHFMV